MLMKIEKHFLTQLTPISNTNVVDICQIIGLRNDDLGQKSYIDSIFSHIQICFNIQI